MVLKLRRAYPHRAESVILNFSVANYRSIETRQEISFLASSLKDNPNGLLESPALPSAAILPALVIYGANASGKSNLLSALEYMRSAVLESQTDWKPDVCTETVQFLLGAENETPKPSNFELNFIFEGVRYQYGFEASTDAFLSEWLYWYPNQHQQKLFIRTGMEFEWGKALRGQREAIRAFTRPNSLYLSAAAQNGHDQLSKIRDAFAQIGREGMSPEGLVLGGPMVQREMDRRAVDYLARMGTGVSGYRLQEKEIDEQTRTLMREMTTVLRKVLGPAAKDAAPPDPPLKNVRTELGHISRDGRTVYFPVDTESAGTRRLLALLGPVFKAIDQGALMVVDEMSNSLHTAACELIFNLFCSRATNPNGAQLLVTTHDTNLLRSPLIRRDQIWFVEKNEYGASDIYPLTDIRTKKTDNIEKGYIQGRYGAVPFAGKLNGTWDEA